MTIRDLWLGTTKEQKASLLGSVVADGVSYATAHAYFLGLRRPKKLYRERIRKYILKYTGIDASMTELWPDIEAVPAEAQPVDAPRT